RGEVRAAACPGAGPDQDRALAGAQPVAELAPPEPAASLRGRPGRDLHVPGRPDLDDVGARAPRLADPEVDDRSPLDNGVVAEDDDQLRVADRRKRTPECVEALADLFRKHRRVCVQADADELCECVGLLVRLGTGKGYRDPAVGLAEQPIGVVQRLFPGDLLEPAPASAPQRVGNPVVGVQVREGKPPLVAEPALVDLGVVPREDPPHLALALVGVDVAADRAEAADRRDALEFPRTDVEARLCRQQRADGAELGDVARERARVGLVFERGDHRLGAPVERDELVVLRDRFAEARAPVAEDAALAIDRDRRRDRDRLLERPLLECHARRARAVAEGQILQQAFAALVADWAVERVVDKDELQGRVLADPRHLRGRRRLDDQSVLRGQGAPGLRLRRHTAALEEPNATGAERGAEPRLVAEDRDLDACRCGGLDDAGALRHLDVPLVDPDCDELGRAHVGTASTTGWWACWSTGANKPSSDDSPPNGQPPWSMWARNSSRNLTT